MSSDIRTKLQLAKERLNQTESALVAYSGGVDSSLLLHLCRDTLGGRVLAVTFDAAIFKSGELDAAADIARALRVEHLVVAIDPLSDPGFTSNPPDRCYYCKAGMLGRLKAIAAQRNIAQVFDGSNFDDLSDYRPGAKAAQKAGIRSPLQEAGLTKVEIRQMARELNLPSWDKPSEPCLASRFPPGEVITEAALRQVEKAEDILYSIGASQVRVRHYGDLAKIEVDPQEIPLLLDESRRKAVLVRLKDLGYHQITVDLEGYRTGSMSEGHGGEPRST